MLKENRGFGSMSETTRREIARKAGRLAHERGTAHEWTPEEAREAGRKGGGVLLSSGDDSSTHRVDKIADALDGIASTLEGMNGQRITSARRAIGTMRQAIEKASKAIDQIEERMERKERAQALAR